jgi:hypothetical protein
MSMTRRGASITAHSECPGCGSAGVRALALSEGHGEVRMGCPACRQVWTIPDRRQKRRHRDPQPNDGTRSATPRS